MKRFMILLTMFTLAACHHSMDSWPSDSDQQEVAMYVRTRNLSGINALPSVYQFFVYDKAKQTTNRYNVSTSGDNQLHIKLFPGSYTGYCVTNAESNDHWEYADNTSPGQIYLKSQLTKNGTEEARDYLLGEAGFEVGENRGNVTFDLNRKVAMLKVIIENIPEWLTDLQINLSNIPQKMSLTGEYLGEYTISKSIAPPDENGTSETSILLFPPRQKASITLSSNAMVFITPEHTIESILANHTTEIKATFQGETDKLQVGINTRLIDWDAQNIQEPGWNIDLPAGPCSGTGNGSNLVLNPGFEDEFLEALPANWKLDNGGATKRVVQVNSPVKEGSHALRLEGKTYLYQDLTISGGTCYQLKMYVNAPKSSIKWRYWCTWMKGSTSLNSDAIRSSSYEYQTKGYIDVFNGQIFRAPADANKLRIEVRTYMDPTESEGLYIDDVSVEPVN